jgi:DinB superfamily
MVQHQEALAGNHEVLAQAADLLGRMSDATYADGGAAPGVSPIGVHVRHVLDHYRALVDGLESGRIDYEARHRRGPLERDRSLALAEVRALGAALDQAAREPEDRELQVNLRSVADPEAGPDWSRSTLKREFQFLVSHTVHHFALIRTLLAAVGIDPGESFGVAPSTVAARRREASGARDLARR